MTSATAPRSDASLTQRGDLPTREYAGFFRDLTTAFNLAANLPQDIQALTVRVDALEEEAGAQIGNIVGDSSVVTDGVLQGGVVTVHLLNDVDIAPALSFYGAITEGVKGWQTFSGNFAALDNGDSTYSLDLSDLANSGVGTALVKITRDGKGRISGTEAATTTDLAEGTNLYYTDERAQDAIGAALDGTGNVPLTYDDAGNKVSAALSSGVLASLTLADSAVQSVVAGTGVSVDNTDPQNPVISTTGSGSGDVVGPASAVDGDIALFDGITGKLIKSGGALATAVQSVVLTGLSLATSAVIAATDTVLQAFGKLQAQITDNLLPAGYIDGLKMVWVSGTALTVTSGAAYVPSLSKVLRASSDIAKTGLSLTASTWYHVYLYSNAGTPDVEVVTTAPAASYSGTARTKTGDISRRYVGSVNTDSSGNIIQFSSIGNLFEYSVTDTGRLRALSNGTATTSTSISFAGAFPVTAVIGKFKLQNNGTTGSTIYISPGGIAASSNGVGVVSAITGTFMIANVDCPLSSSQNINYITAGGASAFITGLGFIFER